MLIRLVRGSLQGNPGTTAWGVATLGTCAVLVTLFATTRGRVPALMASELRHTGANAVLYAGEDVPGVAAGKTAGRRDRWQAALETCRDRGADVAELHLRVALACTSPVAVVAAEPKAIRRMTPYWRVDGRRPVDAGECLVGSRLAGREGVRAGSTLNLSFPGEGANAGGAATLRVVGVAATGDEDDDRVFVSLFPALPGPGAPQMVLPPGHPSLPEGRGAGAARCAGCHDDGERPSSFSEAASIAPGTAVPTPDRDSTGFVYALLSVPGGEGAIDALGDEFLARSAALDLRPIRPVLFGQAHILEKVDRLGLVTLAAVLALTILGVVAAVFARTEERRHEVALMTALGASRRAVGHFILAECSVQGIAAAVTGYLSGTLLARAVIGRIFGTSIPPDGGALAWACGVSVLVAGLSGILAAQRATAKAPVEGLREA